MPDLLQNPDTQLLLPEILEQLAFVFCDLIDKDHLDMPFSEEDAVVAKVRFSGAQGEGFCRFGAAMGLGYQIAGNLMNLEPDDEQLPQLASDALQEVANVVAGHLVTRCLDQDEQFTIEAPETAVWEASRWHAAILTEDACAYLADDYPVWVEAAFSPATCHP